MSLARSISTARLLNIVADHFRNFQMLGGIADQDLLVSSNTPLISNCSEFFKAIRSYSKSSNVKDIRSWFEVVWEHLKLLKSFESIWDDSKLMQMLNLKH